MTFDGSGIASWFAPRDLTTFDVSLKIRGQYYWQSTVIMTLGNPDSLPYLAIYTAGENIAFYCTTPAGYIGHVFQQKVTGEGNWHNVSISRDASNTYTFAVDDRPPWSGKTTSSIAPFPAATEMMVGGSRYYVASGIGNYTGCIGDVTVNGNVLTDFVTQGNVIVGCALG
jgi:hypothetical protein